MLMKNLHFCGSDCQNIFFSKNGTILGIVVLTEAEDTDTLHMFSYCSFFPPYYFVIA